MSCLWINLLFFAICFMMLNTVSLTFELLVPMLIPAAPDVWGAPLTTFIMWSLWKSLAYNLIRILTLTYSQYALSPHVVSYEGLQEMVSHFVKLLYLLDMSAYDGLLLLEDSDRTEYLSVCVLPVYEY